MAVTGNVTVTGQTSRGWVAVTPDPVGSPSTSTLNFPAADTRANGLTVALGSGGTLSAVYHGSPGASTHLVFDVTGYYMADLAGTQFVPLVPVRVLDSRVITGLAGPFVSGTPRVLTLVPGGAIPPTAAAITGNLTVVNARAAGWVALTELPTASPGTSTPNSPVADTRANGITAPLSSTGTVALFHGGSSGITTDLILDITGYFQQRGRLRQHKSRPVGGGLARGWRIGCGGQIRTADLRVMSPTSYAPPRDLQGYAPNADRSIRSAPGEGLHHRADDEQEHDGHQHPAQAELGSVHRRLPVDGLAADDPHADRSSADAEAAAPFCASSLPPPAPPMTSATGMRVTPFFSIGSP